MDNLPQEKRKAYLLQPKSMLTYQTLIETILEADGITKEMIEDQQKRLKLLERLLRTPKADRIAVIEQEKDLLDMHFFTLLSRIVQATAAQGDQNSQKELLDLQQICLKIPKPVKRSMNRPRKVKVLSKPCRKPARMA